MNEEKYEVNVRNKVLGDSTRIMTMSQLKNYNDVALKLARKASQDYEEYFMGMWSVRRLKPKEY